MCLSGPMTFRNSFTSETSKYFCAFIVLMGINNKKKMKYQYLSILFMFAAKLGRFTKYGEKSNKIFIDSKNVWKINKKRNGFILI